MHDPRHFNAWTETPDDADDLHHLDPMAPIARPIFYFIATFSLLGVAIVGYYAMTAEERTATATPIVAPIVELHPHDI